MRLRRTRRRALEHTTTKEAGGERLLPGGSVEPCGLLARRALPSEIVRARERRAAEARETQRVFRPSRGKRP